MRTSKTRRSDDFPVGFFIKIFPSCDNFAPDMRQVWDVDYLKKGDFLGEVRLSKQDLAEQVPVDGDHEFTAVLQPKPNNGDRFNRLVQGSLRFTCQVGEHSTLQGFSPTVYIFYLCATFVCISYRSLWPRSTTCTFQPTLFEFAKSFLRRSPPVFYPGVRSLQRSSDHSHLGWRTLAASMR